MYVLDTSFILALFQKKEKASESATRFWIENQSATFIAPEMLLIELYAFFVRKEGIEAAILKRDKISENIELHANYTNIEHIYDAINAYKLKGPDSMFARLAKRHKATLVTCDKELAAAYEKSVLIK